MPQVEEVLRLTSTGYSVGDGWSPEMRCLWAAPGPAEAARQEAENSRRGRTFRYSKAEFRAEINSAIRRKFRVDYA